MPKATTKPNEELLEKGKSINKYSNQDGLLNKSLFDSSQLMDHGQESRLDPSLGNEAWAMNL